MRSASTARNRCPGTMVRSVQPAPAARRGHRRRATVSSARTVVVPTATTRRPSRAGPPDRRGRRVRDLEALGLHPMVGDSLGADRPERPRSDVERHPVELDALAPRARPRSSGREVEARRRRGHRAGRAPRRPSGSAPSPRRPASGTGGCTAAAAGARGPRGSPRRGPRHRGGRAPVPAPPGPVTVARAAPSARTTGVPTGQRPRRAEERRPLPVHGVEQQDLDVALGPVDPAEEPRGQDARVVHDEAVPRPEEAPEVAHPGVPDAPDRRSSTSSRAASRGSAGSWAMRSGGQRVVELGEVAGARRDASQSRLPSSTSWSGRRRRPPGRRRHRRPARAPRTRRARSASAGS